MAFCLPTTYFTSALFPSPVVGSVGFVLGTDSGLDIFFLRSLLSVMTYSNLSELQKGFNERARYTLSAWRQSVLVCKASALQIDIRGSPRGEISYVQEFPRIILAWKPMQTFFLGSALNLSCGSKEVLICLSYPTLVHLLHFFWPPIMQEVSVHWAHLSPHWATEPFCTTQQ